MLRLTFADPLRSLLLSCQVHCVPECCGVNAYEVDAAQMLFWITREGLASAKLALEQLSSTIAQAANFNGKIISGGEDFNAIWEATACTTYLATWQRELVLAISRHAGQ